MQKNRLTRVGIVSELWVQNSSSLNSWQSLCLYVYFSWCFFWALVAYKSDSMKGQLKANTIGEV